MRIVAFLLAVCLSLGAQAVRAGEGPVIAAAADLQFALTEVAAVFQEETGQEVRLSFGSSGNFTRQIREGAPFEIFLSADEDFVLSLHRDGFTRDEGALYAVGRIALILPAASPLAADGTLADLARAVEAGEIQRWAIANPEHAPYGDRAREALRNTGLWEALEPRLVLGENVAQAAQFALSGNADGGVVALSLALAPEVAQRSRHAVIPDNLHRPLNQRMVLLNGAGPVAESFFDFMSSPRAREVMERYGFTLPES